MLKKNLNSYKLSLCLNSYNIEEKIKKIHFREIKKLFYIVLYNLSDKL